MTAYTLVIFIKLLKQDNSKSLQRDKYCNIQRHDDGLTNVEFPH